MSARRVSSISSKAIGDALALGLCDDDSGCDEIVSALVSSSAPVTHPKGNRRYDDWIFKLVDGEVLSVSMIMCHECNDKKWVTVSEECPHCEGAGCRSCRLEGTRPRRIPCQTCRT